MTPPQLAADTPVLDVVHPLVIGIDPVFGHKFHFARLHCVNRFLRDTFSGGVFVADLVHGHKPLVRQHGLYHLAGTGANRKHHFVRFDFQHQTLGFQIAVYCLARVKAVQTLVGRWAVFVDFGIQGKDGDEWQIVPLRAGVVIEVVRARDLDAARPKSAVYKVVGDDGNLPVAQGQIDHFSY